MKRRLAVLAFAVSAATVLAIGCSQAAPPASSTQPAAAPTKAAAAPAQAPAAQPTAAPAAQPTAAPKAATFPEKGKTITLIVPYAPGGGTDVNARMVASGMEKVLGTPVQVVNKAGAGSQVGVTELVQAKPDGYTVGATSQPGTTLLYLDPERKAVFDRKSFVPIATYGTDPQFLTVKSDSPFKTTQDLIDAAKANPEKVKMGTSGLLGAEHVAILHFASLANIKPAAVHFDGSGPAMTALLGGHIDAYVGNMATFASPFKSGQVRFLAVMDEEESPLAPGVKTLASQGYKVSARIGRVMSAPAGTPKEVVNVLAEAIKKTVEDEAYKKKAAEMYLTPRFIGPEGTLANWEAEEATMRPLVQEVTKNR